MLRLDDIAAGIQVGDDQIKSAYDQRQSEFVTPEEREVSQMLLPDEAAATAAEAQLQSGKAFAAVAKDVAKMDDPKSLDLGWVKRADLPPNSATRRLRRRKTPRPRRSRAASAGTSCISAASSRARPRRSTRSRIS